MKTLILGMLTSMLVVSAAAAGADDRADIEALIAEYNRTEETGDLDAQMKLMSPDRVWINGLAGRRTDQTLNMKVQQAGLNEAKKRFGGAKHFFEVRDLIVQTHGDAAVASFYWIRNRVFPADYEGPRNQPMPLIQTLVLVKTDGDWKIVHSHASPMVAQN